MRSSGRVVPPLAARRSPTDELFIKGQHRERGQFVAFLFGIFKYVCVFVELLGGLECKMRTSNSVIGVTGAFSHSISLCINILQRRDWVIGKKANFWV